MRSRWLRYSIYPKTKNVMYRFLFFFLLISSVAHAQLTGVVMEKGGDMLPGASVSWKNTGIGIATDSAGKFNLSWPEKFPATLMIRQLGYLPDSLRFEAVSTSPVMIHLKRDKLTAKGVTIEGRQKSGVIDTYKPINGELITSKGLLKAACCNLSESFETNPSVDAAMTDAVSGARKIQMLGLDGVYAQILNENLPLVRGLSGAYGMSSIPGTWINSILITKGTGSVVNGYESISGQINLDMIKPTAMKEKLLVNLYGNNFGRTELNIQGGKKFDDYSGTMLFLHASTQPLKFDRNNDGFLDMPLTKQINGMNRWMWHKGDRVEGQIGLRGFIEQRRGGQKSFDYANDFGTTNHYGIGVDTRQAELFAKTGIVYPEKPYKSIGTMFSARYHDQSMFFGLKKYFGLQRSIYANVLYQSIFNNTNHVWKAGVSYVLDDYREGFNDSGFVRTEMVPGAFFEYTGHFGEKFSAVAGVRGDLHNKFGFMVDPRLHLKYDLTKNTILRASGGRGFRTANVFTENSSVFASSRSVVITQALKPEIAWNYGGSITQKFKIGKHDHEGSINVDFFRTDFVNQVVVNIEDPHVVRFENLNGQSYANSLQADISIEPFDRFDVLASYKWYDVRADYSGQFLQRPLQPRQRALLNLAYATNFERWKFDFTIKGYGKARVPASGLTTAQESAPFMIMLTQITKKFRYIDLYAGGENLLDYRQRNPIIDPANPFGSNFDASLIWAPVDGRVIYGGIRFHIDS